MTDLIKQRHGNTWNFILNLVLLGILGALALRICAVATYTLLPNSYFLQSESLTITDVNVCGEQEIQAETVRHIYPYLPEAIVKNRALQADTRVELFRSDSRKIDDLERTPIIEWKEGGHNLVEWNFNTTMLPGRYYIEITSFIKLPIIGTSEEPIRIRSNDFVVGLCEPILKTN